MRGRVCIWMTVVLLVAGSARAQEFSAEVRHGKLAQRHTVVLSALGLDRKIVAEQRSHPREDGVAKLALDSVPEDAVAVTAHVLELPGMMSSVAWPRSDHRALIIHLLENCEPDPELVDTAEFVAPQFCTPAENTGWFTQWLGTGHQALIDLAFLTASGDEYIPEDWVLKVENPVPLKKKNPTYSGSAHHHKIHGYVLLQVVIGKDGRVSEPTVLRSDITEGWGFRRSATKAVSRWKYRPATLLGEPVEVYSTVMIEFALQ